MGHMCMCPYPPRPVIVAAPPAAGRTLLVEPAAVFGPEIGEIGKPEGCIHALQGEANGGEEHHPALGGQPAQAMIGGPAQAVAEPARCGQDGSQAERRQRDGNGREHIAVQQVVAVLQYEGGRRRQAGPV